MNAVVQIGLLDCRLDMPSALGNPAHRFQMQVSIVRINREAVNGDPVLNRRPGWQLIPPSALRARTRREYFGVSSMLHERMRDFAKGSLRAADNVRAEAKADERDP